MPAPKTLGLAEANHIIQAEIGRASAINPPGALHNVNVGGTVIVHGSKIVRDVVAPGLADGVRAPWLLV